MHVHRFGLVYLAQGHGYRLSVAHQRECVVGITFGRDVKRFVADGMPERVQWQVVVIDYGKMVAYVLMCQRDTEVVHSVSGIGCRPGEVGSRSALQFIESTLLGNGKKAVVSFGQIKIYTRLRTAEVWLDVRGDKASFFIVDEYARTLQVVVVLEVEPYAVLASAAVVVHPVGAGGKGGSCQTDNQHS